MIKLLKCELLKMRHRYVFLSALAIVAAGLVFSLYGNYRGTIADFIMKNGWVMMLYQLPLANGIFFPIMATVVASRLADAEHKASAFKHFFPDSTFTIWDIRDDDIQSMADNFAISLDKRKNPSKIYINAGSKVYEIKIPKPEENKETNRKGG